MKYRSGGFQFELLKLIQEGLSGAGEEWADREMVVNQPKDLLALTARVSQLF